MRKKMNSELDHAFLTAYLTRLFKMLFLQLKRENLYKDFLQNHFGLMTLSIL